MTLLQRLLNSPIVKNLSILVSGTAIAQLIVIGFQIVLRRVYLPADFGAFAVYMSVVGILATVSSLRYEQTILLPEKKIDSIKLFKLSALLAFVFSLLSFVLFLLFQNILIEWLNFPKAYTSWFLVIPLTILVFSISQALNFFLIREKRFSLSSSNKVIRRASEGIAQAGFGYIGKSFGLFIGDIIGQIVVIIRTAFKIKATLKGKFKYTDYIDIAKQYKAFPLKNGLPSLFNALSLLLPIIILNRLFNEELTGYFDLARMVLIIPLSLVTASLSQVLLQRFTEKNNLKQSIRKEAFGTFGSLLIFALVFGIVIQFFGEPIFKFVFGKQWGASGSYASILVWAFAFKFVISPFNITFTAFQKIGVLSIWQSIYFLLILLLNWLPFKSIEEFLYAYLAIEIISYSIVGVFNFVLIAKYESSIKC